MRRINVDRLRRMSRHEWQWRATEALHRLGERVHTRVHAPQWDRRSYRALAEQIRARPARFVLDPSSAPALRERVLTTWPGAGQEAADRAERLLQGRFDLLGYSDVPCARSGRIDWHRDPIHGRRAPQIFYGDVPYLDPEIGDHKIIWELNRHQHWLQLGRAAWLTGEGRYAQAIVHQLDDWLGENPPLIGINWASMLEVGLRAISWTWAIHFLLAEPAAGSWKLEVGHSCHWLVDMLAALDRQLTHVERHLSFYFSPNTHLTGEALALYVVGTAFPELSASQRWVSTGRSVLLAEIDNQILADGGHVERSTHYQRYTLDFYLLATLTARRAGDEVTARRLANASSRVADFTMAIADSQGRLPLIGDDDGGMLWPIAGRACNDVRDSLALAAVVLNRPELAAWGVPEEVGWIAGAEALAFQPAKTRTASRLLPDSGYFVARGTDGSHAVLDAGPHGYRNGGHAHADALSLTLAINGQPLLIDPGTSTYTMDSGLRDRMRSSASHNTLTLDGRSQSAPDGPFHWRSTVDARVIACSANDVFDWIEAAHDGYAPARHRRTVIRTPDSGWLIVDTVTGSDQHSATSRWHFDPSWRVTSHDGRVSAIHPDGQSAWMLCAGGSVTLNRGDTTRGVGCCAPVYGQLVPTSTVHMTTDATAPLSLVTWVASGGAFASPSIQCHQSIERDDETVIVEVDDGPRVAVFMVRPTHVPHRQRICRVGDFETDAVMLHYTIESGRLRRVIAQGAGRCPEVRVNGHELPLSSNSPTDSLLIRGSDWLSFSAGKADPSAIAKCGAAFAQ